MGRLPEYLKIHTEGKAPEQNIVTFGNVRITAITPRLIRIEKGNWTDRASMTVLHRDFCPCELSVNEENGTVKILTDALEISYQAGAELVDGLSIRSRGDVGFCWHFGQKPIHNLGGTVSTLDGVEGACEIEDGICSLDGFACIDDTKTPLFDEEGWLTARETEADIYFFGYGHDYTACVQDYYRLTGKPEMLPAFVFGNWWSRYHAYSAQEYLDLMDQFHEKDVPLSVGIVDMDWHLTRGEDWKPHHDGWTGYTWNEALFPDYKAFIKELHKRGLHTALNLHPAKGVQSYEKQYKSAAERMGIDPATEKTVPCDYLNPEYLKTYFEELHFPYEKDGIDFWWMDWQQGCDYAVVMGEDYVPNPLESVKPLWLLNHMHYIASKRDGKRGLIFSRFCGFGSQRYPIGFSGDTLITWDSLDFQPYFTVTASNIGYGWWSHDIGGHWSGIRDDELTTRWVQFGVFSPIFRLHSTDSVFLGREPWRYNKRAEAVISDFMRLRHRMFPYLYTMCHRDCTQLLPLMRPMYHVHPECKDAYRVKNQYYFGSELMVSPITEKSDGSDLGHARVWLPEGIWTDAFTGYIYKGNQLADVYRPLETMPVFMKAGAIVPMQKHNPHNADLGNRADMEVYIAPGADGNFCLYEDDGNSLAYQNGEFCSTEMRFTWTDTCAEFTIHPALGALKLIPGVRNWTLHFRGFRKGCEFTSEGNKITAAFDQATNTYTVVLTGKEATNGIRVVLRHEENLIHDNTDCREIVIDRLTRAQNSLAEKELLLRVFDERYNQVKYTGACKRCECGVGTDAAIGGLIWELLSQL